ncbi:MAG TPA: PQQ-binding-like beta-propeller repeat protein, partial [Acidimicrobiales bacterium]|nr:PQQ-binding-like beta-propeller repeat protein [Acidimicrobiales bacterium]
SSPAVANGVVYVGSRDGKLYAFDAAGGAPVWAATTGGAVDSSPAVASGMVYVGSNDDKLYAFDAATGAPRWAATTGDNVFSSPAVANGVAYVGSNDGKLYAFDAVAGTPLWTATTGGVVFSSPAVANGVVYVGSFDVNGLYAFDAAGSINCSGTPKTCLPLWTAMTRAAVTSSPAVAHGFVYASAGDGKLHVFSPAVAITTQASAGGPAGTAVTDTATLSGGFNPTGTVTFRLFSDSSCTAQVFTSTNAVAGGTATSGATAPAAGTYYWTAVYSGDANNTTATSPCNAPDESVTITNATLSISTQASAGNLVGAPVRDVATVSGGFNPTGTLTFRLYGPDDATCSGSSLTTSVAVAGNGSYPSAYLTPAAPGTYRWTVAYGGDANNNAASSPCNAPNESLTLAPFAPPAPTRTITGDFLGPLTVNAGESVLVTAARVFGPITVNPGGALSVVNSQVSGGVAANAPSFFSLCNTDVSPPGVTVTNATVPIRIGDPAGGCAGNRIAGDVTLTANAAGFTAGANRVRNLTATNNGPGLPVIKANTVFQTLACSANAPAPVNAGQPNTASAKTGQCAGL